MLNNSINIKLLSKFLLVIFVVSVFFTTPAIANVDHQNKNYIEGELIVKYKNNKIDLKTTTGRVKSSLFNINNSLENKEYIDKNNISVLKITDGNTVEQKITDLESDPNIEYVQPNYLYHSTSINTNDTNRGLLWGLDNSGQTVNSTTGTVNADINAPEAWGINEGINNPQIVAIIDTGVNYSNPDLSNQMWNGSSCKDDSANGGVLIVGGCNHGYDYEDSDNTPLPTTSYHGTHIAGIIAAEKNN
ncbi:MAG: S8 family serine peptidase, partial [Candidatus Nomurabacteria bacterium]|nr:S8 family serine peptidase [Candidatus Nomurabacteria bacterium]